MARAGQDCNGEAGLEWKGQYGNSKERSTLERRGRNGVIMDLKAFIMSRLTRLSKEELVEALATHILKHDQLREEWRETQRREPMEEASVSQETSGQEESADQRRLTHG